MASWGNLANLMDKVMNTTVKTVDNAANLYSHPPNTIQPISTPVTNIVTRPPPTENYPPPTLIDPPTAPSQPNPNNPSIIPPSNADLTNPGNTANDINGAAIEPDAKSIEIPIAGALGGAMGLLTLLIDGDSGDALLFGGMTGGLSYLWFRTNGIPLELVYFAHKIKLV